MDEITSPDFAAAVAFCAVGLFLLSLIPVAMAGSVISKLRMQGKLKAANTGGGLTGSDKWLFWFQKNCESYYLLFYLTLFFSVFLGASPWLCHQTEEDYRGFYVGQPHHERLFIKQMIYNAYGPRGVIVFTKTMCVLLALVGIVTIGRAIRKIVKKESLDSNF